MIGCLEVHCSIVATNEVPHQVVEMEPSWRKTRGTEFMATLLAATCYLHIQCEHCGPLPG